MSTFKQWAIFLTGAAAILLTVEGGDWLRWGALVGLVGQPFWLWDTAKKRQWGIFALSLWYAEVYARGVWRAWF